MAQKLIYLYLIFLPLMKIPKISFMGEKMQYADLIFIPLSFLFLYKLVKEKFRFMISKINIYFFILTIISFLSFYHSQLKQEILLDFFGLVYLVFLYFTFTSLINKDTEFIKINKVLFITTVFISISGILLFTLYNFFHLSILSSFFYKKAPGMQSALVPFSRISSFLNLPEMYINFILLGLASAFVYREHLLDAKLFNLSRRRLVDVGILVIILSAFFAFSRSLIGVLFFLTMITGFRKKTKPISILHIFCLVVFLILFLSTIITWFYTIYPISFSIDETTKVARLSFNSNFDARLYLTKAALAIGQTHPFLGLGLGTFTNHFINFLSLKDVMALSAIRQVPPSLLRLDPHSLYFGAIAEIGFFGMIILIFTFATILNKLVRSYKESQEWFYKKSCYIFLSAILSFLLNGFFVDILSMRSFWVLLSFGMTAVNLSKKGSQVK